MKINSAPKVFLVNILSFPKISDVFHKFNIDGTVNCVLSIDFELKAPIAPLAERLDLFKCISGCFPGIDQASPCDEELILQMRNCEAIFLKMYDRLDYSNRISYEVRKFEYLKQLRFWNWKIEQYQPEFCFFATYPHELYDYVLYELCKLKGVRTYIFEECVM